MVVLSGRTTLLPASPIRAMMAQAACYPDAVRLEMGEPDFTTPVPYMEAAFAAARAGATHYTPTLGLPELRRAIAARVRTDYGLELDPDREILVSTGAVGALAVACLAVVEPGDEVLVPDPGWPVYRSQVALAGGVVVPVPLREENAFHLRAEDLEARITPRSRVLIVNSPHNPTGAVLGEGELREIADVAYRHGLVIISDEVYEKLLYDGRLHFPLAAVPEVRPRVITISGVSKTYAMTGWRLGYAHAVPEIISAMTRIQECLASCTSSLAQHAALAALAGDQGPVGEMHAQYDRRRRFLVEGLNRLPGISCLLPEGALYVFPSVGGRGHRSAELARELLARARVVTVPGSGFGEAGEGYLRLSYATSLEALEEALRRLERFFA
ncbi:MAG: pyridoxal phosphate-dependent aminotransferase [Bacillota bacterium]